MASGAIGTGEVRQKAFAKPHRFVTARPDSAGICHALITDGAGKATLRDSATSGTVQAALQPRCRCELLGPRWRRRPAQPTADIAALDAAWRAADGRICHRRGTDRHRLPDGQRTASIPRCPRCQRRPQRNGSSTGFRCAGDVACQHPAARQPGCPHDRRAVDGERRTRSESAITWRYAAAGYPRVCLGSRQCRDHSARAYAAVQDPHQASSVRRARSRC